MSNDSPTTVWQTQEANPLSSVTFDNPHDANDQKPDARRFSGGSRRSGRKKDESAVKAEKDTTDANTNGKTSKNQKETKPRKGRPREKSTTTPMSTSRKKPKLESPPETPANGVTTASPAPGAAPGPAPPRSPQTAANFSGSAMPLDHQHNNSSTPPTPHNNHPNPPPPTQPSTFSPYSRPPSSSYSLPPTYSHSHPQPQPQPQPPPQRTSGQNYDPIRSAFDTSSPAPTPSAVSPPAYSRSPNNYRASASPAINSIIDPPAPASQSVYDPIPRVSSSHNLSSMSAGSIPQRPPVSSPLPAPSPHRPSSGHQQQLSFVQQPPPHSAYSYPHQLSQGPMSQQQQQPQPQPQPQEQRPQHEFSMPQPSQTQQQPPEQPKPQSQSVSGQPPVAMDVDTDKSSQPITKPATSKKEKSTNAASKAPSPNPPRGSKDTQVLPQGSGLISNALFGKDGSPEPSESKTAPDIILRVPLKAGENRIINFARLAEEQYGFAALHPRLAAHRERLARVAAAGAALEKDKKGKAIEGESADEDLSLDVDRDSEMDGDAAMGGMGSATNTNDAAEADDGKKRRKKKKAEEYDRDDPFVDDSEMVWQEQAAASKDGFFVYSGPLVPEGDKVQVERADGTIKRGRGRGRGGRSRGLTSTHQQPLAAAPISQETGLPLRGPGSRGGTSRRGRTTKKQSEQDKPGSERPIMKASLGRGGASTGRGGGTSTRGAKTPSTPAELAPAPTSSSSSSSSKPNLAPAYPGTSVFTPSELMMKP